MRAKAARRGNRRATPARGPRIAGILACVAVVLLAFADPASAHRMLIREVEPGLLEAYYEGGHPAKEVAVTFYDADDNVVRQGTTGEDGRIPVPPGEGMLMVEADDGLGHRVVYDVEAARVEDGVLFIGDDVPLALRVAIALAMLFAVAAAGTVWTRRRGRP